MCNPNRSSWQPAWENEYLFLSSYHSLRARGIYQKLQTPARSGGYPGGEFAAAVSAAFASARAAGIRQPVLMGAIPFDLDQPSQLFIPQETEFVSRDSLLQSMSGGALSGQLLTARSQPDEKGFKAAVRQAIVNFQHSEIRKTVLSRICELQFAQPVPVGKLFASLCAQNPSGYQFSLPMQDGSTLLGVSPELLLRKEGGRIATFPLAGSAKRHIDTAQDEAVSRRLLDSAKDHYEHSLVIDDIRQVLAPYCRQLQVPSSPTLLSTRAMWHLGSPIEGELHDENLSVLQLACQLHPTPAVCGFPTALSRKLINLIEPFERGVFSGMVGWCNEDGDGEWVVTIRCATVREETVRLFAGAGIVEASCPDAEWAETQAKLGTMLAAFGLTAAEVLA